ncbi:MAG TPA: hypothetical protein VF212_05185 [Longimicrobiales bacterium]
MLLAAALLNACYAYAPVTGEAAPHRGARVRVTLDRPRPVVLTDFAVHDAVVLTGEVIRADERSLLLSASAVASRSGFESRGRGETVAVPRDQIRSVERHRFSTLRSAALAGIVVLLGAVVGAVAGGVGGGGAGRPVGGQPH